MKPNKHYRSLLVFTLLLFGLGFGASHLFKPENGKRQIAYSGHFHIIIIKGCHPGHTA